MNEVDANAKYEKLVIIEAGVIVSSMFDDLPRTAGAEAVFWLLVDTSQGARETARRLGVSHVEVLRARHRLLKLVYGKSVPAPVTMKP